MMRFGTSMLAMGTTVVLTATVVATPPAIPSDQVPLELQGVRIDQHLNAQVPGELTFTDHTGATVQLSDLVAGGDRPVILSLNYYRCPQLCTLTLNGLVDGLEGVDLTLGDDYDIVTVSIDPNETAELAAQNRRGYLANATQRGVEVTQNAWPFLVGEQSQIEQLAEAVGFGYRFDEASGEYAHTSSIMFITPEGRISKYMNNVRFPARDVHFALVEASQGNIGSLVDGFLLFNCFQWDPTSNTYIANAWKLMRLGGVFIVLLILIGWFVLWRMAPTGTSGDGDGDQPSAGKEVLS
jgi:protein SCO1/2